MASRIQFHLLNAAMRRELLSLHLPNPDRVTADYAFLAGLSRGLSSYETGFNVSCSVFPRL